MHELNYSATVPYSAEDMFALVENIPAYPEFLPWCSAAIIHARGENEVRASLELSIGGIHRSFTTHNHMDAPHRISMQLVDGPFRALDGEWRFESQPGGSRMTLSVQYAFSNPLAGVLLNHTVADRTRALFDAFRARADSLHGSR